MWIKIIVLCYLLASTPQQQIEKQVIYDIPLTETMQQYTREVAQKYNVPFSLVLGVMKVESNFNPNVKSHTNDYGLMQINACNISWLRETLGANNILDPEYNIECGTLMLGDLYKRYNGDLNKVLMAYNIGENGAKSLWKQGIFETSYCVKVKNAMAEIERSAK